METKINFNVPEMAEEAFAKGLYTVTDIVDAEYPLELPNLEFYRENEPKFQFESRVKGYKEAMSHCRTLKKSGYWSALNYVKQFILANKDTVTVDSILEEVERFHGEIK